jgi:ADP-ribosylglycohydrolase
VAESINDRTPFPLSFRKYYQAFPKIGFPDTFKTWAEKENAPPYKGIDNLCAVRVSPICYVAGDLDKVLLLSKASAECTHNHPDGVKGAQAVASATFMAFQGKSKDEIKAFISGMFGYNLNRTLAQIRPNYQYDTTCKGSVGEAIIAFLESTSFEDAVRKAVSLGGDAKAQACIAGSIAEGFYGGISPDIQEKVVKRLDPLLREVTVRFVNRYMNKVYPKGIKG